jgi:hypothetical protein
MKIKEETPAETMPKIKVKVSIKPGKRTTRKSGGRSNSR